jgi:phospholipid transport system substrate-binding protein
MRRFPVIVLVLTATVGAPGIARAGVPTEQLREYTDRVLKILEEPGLQAADRRAAVRRVANEVFDVTETARRALGQHWQQRTPAERDQFVQAFADLLEQTYISRIDEYGGERIRYVGEQVDGDQAVVRARIITRQNTEVPVESRLLRRGERWLIYDVLIENVSLVANYRSQFDRIIRTASFDVLLRRLRARNDALQTAPSRRGSDPGRK